MDLGNMMKGMQKKMLEMQKVEEEKKLKARFIGESGGGLVKVTLNGSYDVLNLYIANKLKEEEDDEDGEQWGFLSDLIAAAFKKAKKQVDESNSGSESDMINNMGLPFKMPF